jgi:hypothetical protein
MRLISWQSLRSVSPVTHKYTYTLDHNGVNGSGPQTWNPSLVVTTTPGCKSVAATKTVTLDP